MLGSPCLMSTVPAGTRSATDRPSRSLQDDSDSRAAKLPDGQPSRDLRAATEEPDGGGGAEDLGIASAGLQLGILFVLYEYASPANLDSRPRTTILHPNYYSCFPQRLEGQGQAKPSAS
jgi:hypothetical protein